MGNHIMVGCDLHQRNMLLKISYAKEPPVKRLVLNTMADRQTMIRDLHRMRERKGAESIVFAYEASSLGFHFYDELQASGITCHVLAPSHLPSSSKQRKTKTDENDANRILEVLRGHLLAGNRLPAVWVPSRTTRDDREIIRMRLLLTDKITSIRNQIQSLLKRNKLKPPEEVGKGWTKRHLQWLRSNCSVTCGMPLGIRITLSSFLSQLEHLLNERTELDLAVVELSQAERYKSQVEALLELKGIHILSAMVFLTEMGDLSRFRNRRQVASYLGLCPSSFESGEQSDRKGHITRQGPARVRRILNQAIWTRIRHDAAEKEAIERIRMRNPKRRKVAVVAAMRRLAIVMWHRCLDGKAV